MRLPLLPLTVIALFVIVSLFGDWLTPVPPNEQSLRLRQQLLERLAK